MSRRGRPSARQWLATLSLTVKQGWHVYANPTGVEDVPPTRVSVHEPAVKIVKVDYPPGVAKLLTSSGKEKVAVYEGKVSISVWFDPATQAAPAEHLKFRVRVQACDDRACLAPAEVVVGDQ